MKCNILTIHHIHNFGSVFQAYALCRFLQQNGYDAELIDYRPAYYSTGKNKLKTAVGKLLNLNAYLRRKRKFERFIRAHDALSPCRYQTVTELETHYKDVAQVFIAGGDQLWNSYHPCGRDDAYKLCFAAAGRKMAYGTSMGRDNFTEDELRSLADKTADFAHIMLREKCTVDPLQKHTAVPIRHAIDPVGLLPVQELRDMAQKPALQEPYAVMYLADSGPLLDAAVDVLSREMGLKIVHICGFRQKCRCDYFIKDAGPEEILGYIAHADFVLSASFHATLFSILFNKPFASLLPGTQTNARIEDLLRTVGLEDRILQRMDDMDRLRTVPAYDGPNAIINTFRSNSQQALLHALKTISEG